MLVWWLGEREPDRRNGEPANHCHESCCTGRAGGNVVRRALEYGFLVLPRDIGLPLLAGVVIAGTISALVPAEFVPTYLGGGIVSIAAMMLLGLPLYVCASQRFSAIPDCICTPNKIKKSTKRTHDKYCDIHSRQIYRMNRYEKQVRCQTLRRSNPQTDGPSQQKIKTH